jgi:hypothetical protein
MGQALPSIRVDDGSPGSASDPVLEPYYGSRKQRQRFAYKENSYAGFIELSPDHVLKGEAYKRLLERVSGVDRVIFHPAGSKSQQGNTSDHYQEHNFYVYSQKYMDRAMEFGLTRFNHRVAREGRPFTITAMFKDVGPQHEDLYVEAWRILKDVCKGKELLPEWTDKQYKRALDRVIGAPDSVSAGDAEENPLSGGHGSASTVVTEAPPWATEAPPLATEAHLFLREEEDAQDIGANAVSLDDRVPDEHRKSLDDAQPPGSASGNILPATAYPEWLQRDAVHKDPRETKEMKASA